jgi:hypothetical protein
LLMRDGWRIYLRKDILRRGPWSRGPAPLTLDDFASDPALRFGQEQ